MSKELEVGKGKEIIKNMNGMESKEKIKKREIIIDEEGIGSEEWSGKLREFEG